MYITITAQKIDSNYAQSSADFVSYLEKENEGKPLEDQEHFFNQYGEDIKPGEVTRDIDANTAKLKKTEPKFYSITLNPSARELQAIKDSPEALKQYTQKVMKEYAKAFNRDIDGKPVSVENIKYCAKVERQRTYKGTDREVRENQPYATRILELKQLLRNIQSGEQAGEIRKLKKEIQKLEQEAPHQLNGKRIVRGMDKPGPQSHVHIIVSRKDASNRFSLSPGSKYKASEVEMHGKTVKRGFDRDTFIKNSEKAFDGMFGYQRNYVETYTARKTFLKDPKTYFSIVSGLPTNERAMAYKLLSKTGVPIPKIPVNTVQLTYRAINRIKKGIGKAMESGSIGI